MPRQQIDIFYDDTYEIVMGTGLIGKYMKLIHKQIEKIANFKQNSIVLEIGAGHGQHFNQANPLCHLYVETDIRESLGYKKRLTKHDFVLSGRIKRIANAENLSAIQDNTVDAIVVTCVLAHLSNPDTALKEWRRVLKVGGNLVVYVPCEPGFILRLARFFTTRRKFLKQGVRHQDLHWLEHRNHYLYLRFLIQSVCKSDQVKIYRYPFALLPWDFNLYYIFRVTKV